MRALFPPLEEVIPDARQRAEAGFQRFSVGLRAALVALGYLMGVRVCCGILGYFWVFSGMLAYFALF